MTMTVNITFFFCLFVQKSTTVLVTSVPVTECVSIWSSATTVDVLMRHMEVSANGVRIYTHINAAVVGHTL